MVERPPLGALERQSPTQTLERPEQKARNEYLASVTAQAPGLRLQDTNRDAVKGYDLPKVDITDQTSEQTEKQRVEAKQKELEEKYGVKFAREGERIKQKLNDNAEPSGQWVTARTPTMEELKAVEAALKHSYPSYRPIDGETLKINFAKEPFFADGGGSANYEAPDKEHPKEAYLNIWPKASRFVPTEADKTGNNIEKTSLEEVLTHELSHAAQAHTGGMGMEKDVPYKRQMGWEPLQQPPTDQTQWALKGKDGKLYTFQITETPQGLQGNWVSTDGKTTRSNDEMREQALVRPATDYFAIPEEMGAEALTQYRMGGKNRARLKDENPLLYKIAEELHQKELERYSRNK